MYLVQVICIKRKSCELARHGYWKVNVLFSMCYLLSSMVQNWAFTVNFQKAKNDVTHPKTKHQNTTAQICPSILCENAEYFCLFINNQGRQSVPKSGRSEGGRERNFGVYQTIAPKTLLLKGYFCLEQGLPALNFRGGAEEVVVHMHWLTWLLWRPCI